MARGKKNQRVSNVNKKRSVPQKEENESPPPKISIKSLAGSSLIKFKPLFSHDSRFLLVIADKNIKVFSTVSGECFRTLVGHDSPVISLQTNPSNRFQILSCSVDATVIKWNYEDGTKLKVFKLDCISSVSCFYAPNDRWFVVPEEKVNDIHQLVVLTPRSESVTKFKKQFVMKSVLADGKSIAFGKEGNFVCSVYENRLQVFHAVDNIFKVHLMQSKLLCVSCHPSEYVIATGEETGRILVWTNFLDSNKPNRSVYHWHALPVADLAFTAEGNYLYSGGSECVLVKWQLGSPDRQYLPRMGRPLCYVTTSPDNSYVATSHLDNAIQLVSPQNQVVQIYQGLTLSDAAEQTGLLYDPRSKAVVTNGRPGHLQFYDMAEDKQLFNLDIVGQNYVTGTTEDETLHFTEVERAAFDCNGEWLATAEYRDDGETSAEIRLKFWSYDKTSQIFNLNTNILLPHNKRINALKFKPPSEDDEDDVPTLLTTSLDQKFKVWVLRDKETTSGDRRAVWACNSLGYYHCLPAGDFDFSEDGSLAGVAFGHALTLWNVKVTALKSALVCRNDSKTIWHVAFGRGTCCHLVVSATASSLSVWNLLSLTVSWTVQTSIVHLAVDPLSSIMAAFTTDQTLFAFNPNDPKPEYIHQQVSQSSVQTAAFIPASVRSDDSSFPWSPLSRLVFLNSQQELVTITDQPDEKEQQTKNLPQNLPKTPFGLLMAQYQKNAVPEETPTVHLTQGIQGIKELNEILNVPSHVLPSVSSICGNFMSSLLIEAEEKPKISDSATSEVDKIITSELEDKVSAPDNDLSAELLNLRLESYDWLVEYLET